MSRTSGRIRVGVDFHVWDGIFQGSRSHLLGLYRAAITQAPDIDFFFFLEGTDLLRRSHSEFSYPNAFLIRTPHRPAIFRLAVQLPLLQLKHRIQLMHTQYRLPFFRFSANACTIHDVLFETHPEFFSKFFVLQSKFSYAYAARRSAILFTVSQFSRREIERHYGPLKSSVNVIYNGVDRDRFYPGSDGAELVSKLGLQSRNYILSVGRLEPRKNHLTLLDAYAKMPPETPPLVIVGQKDFKFKDTFERLHDSDLKGRVILLEKVDDATLPALMRHAKLFVYPAFAEGFGMPIAEAMASGVPVITSNTTAIPEVAGDAAILVDPTSPLELLAAMAKVLGNEELQREMIASGLNQVSQFLWTESAKVLIAAIRDFLHK